MGHHVCKKETKFYYLEPGMFFQAYTQRVAGQKPSDQDLSEIIKNWVKGTVKLLFRFFFLSTEMCIRFPEWGTRFLK